MISTKTVLIILKKSQYSGGYVIQRDMNVVQ